MPKKKDKKRKKDISDDTEFLLEVDENQTLDKTLDDIDQMQINKVDEKKVKTKDTDDLKVAESVLDVETRTTLFNLRRRKVIEEMTGVISTGKEANVYHAYAPDGAELAVKIYRTSTNIFKGLQIYIIGDPRFARIKRDQRSFVHAWAKKEFKNLSRAHKAGVNVPKPITSLKDVVVMEFIGKKGLPYRIMKEEKIKKPTKTYNEVLDNLHKLYKKAGLVHADLSEYNMLYTPTVVFIDISQAVLIDHPYSDIFLYRDIKNITRYFKGLKVDVFESDVLYESLTDEPPSDKVKAYDFD